MRNPEQTKLLGELGHKIVVLELQGDLVFASVEIVVTEAMHAAHDAMLNAGYRRHFGFELRNHSLDTMDLTLHLERDGAFAGSPKIRSFDFDTLCDRFGLKPHDRHTAGGDAFLTAQILLRLLRLGCRFHRHALAALCEPFVPAEVEQNLRPGHPWNDGTRL